jgi:glycosyltransferase involved in cell wall biosynthesis
VYPPDRYEIIVVDNASRDNTPELVRRLQKDVPERNLHYVLEKELGLHNARHAGARMAKGEILVYTDDDAIFDPYWIKAYAGIFGKHGEMVAAGGPVRPLWEVPPPKWLLDYMNGAKKFGMLSLMEPHEGLHLDTNCFFFGVNMAIRRDVLFQVGGFNPELIGKFTAGDGESGLLRKLQRRDLLVGYVPDAIVYHRIPESRMTMGYLCRWQAHLAGTRLYPRYHKRMPRPFGLFMDGLAMLPSFLKAWVKALFVQSPTDRHSISLHLRAALESAKLRYVMCLLFNSKLREIVTRENWLNPKPQALEIEE